MANRRPALSNRLRFLFNRIGEAARVIDVGTDHAALPIALIEENICDHVIGTDINRGPYAAARKNVRAAGLEDRIDIMLTDGLTGIELRPDDTIVIAGMGGLEMTHILQEVSFDPRQRYLLQPNWTWTDLRAFLSAKRAAIRREDIILDRGKLYPFMEVCFDGSGKELEHTECFAGPDLIRQLADGETVGEQRTILTRYFERLHRLAAKRGIGDETWRQTANNIERLLYD